VLPDNNGILIEIGNVSTTDTFGILLHDHPANMRIQQAFTDAVWVLGGVGVAVVSAVITAPPADGSFNRASPAQCQKDFEWPSSRITLVCPQPMVTSSDTETCAEVVENCPDGCLELQRRPDGSNAADDRDAEDECAVQPIDVLIPVLPSYR